MSSMYLQSVASEVAALQSAQHQANSAASSQIDALIARLERAKSANSSRNDGDGDSALTELQHARLLLSNANKEVAKEYKSATSALSKAQKAVDKRFLPPSGSLFPTTQDPFTSAEAVEALHEAIATHLARTGDFRTLDSFRRQTGAQFDESILDSLQELHTILSALEKGDCSTALKWLALQDRANVDPHGNLEFALRQEEFIRLLLGSSPSVSEPLLSSPPMSNVTAALRYGGQHLLPMMTPERKSTIGSLLASPLYLPFSRLLSSPYASLFAPYAAADEQRGNPVVLSMFSESYLQSVGMSRQSPLEVAAEIGANGAVAKIQKVQNVMKETKTEWTTVDELPVEIPLPTRHRYHSIFACPVSKEQASTKNPPMMLPCGHVIARESMLKQAKSAPTLKCTYCPQISHVNAAIKIAFVL